MFKWLGINFTPWRRKPRQVFMYYYLPLKSRHVLTGDNMQIPLGDQDVARITVLDAQGDVLPSWPTTVWTSSDPSVKIAPAADGLSAVLTPSKLIDGVVITATIVPPSGTNPGVVATGTVDAVAGVPASATMTFDPPTPITPATPAAPATPASK